MRELPADTSTAEAAAAAVGAPAGSIVKSLIFMAEGSPLLVHSRALADAVGHELGAGYRVELGMRYGEPSLAGALDALVAADVERVAVLPLFPQEAGSSSGSDSEPGNMHATDNRSTR